MAEAGGLAPQILADQKTVAAACRIITRHPRFSDLPPSLLLQHENPKSTRIKIPHISFFFFSYGKYMKVRNM